MKYKEFKETVRDIIQECVVELRIENMVKSVMNEAINGRQILSEEESGGSRRSTVMKMLHDEKFDHAYLAYKLWHPKDQGEKDTYRSLFSKKFSGKPDADGTVRRFSSKEINKLYNMLKRES